MGEDSGVTESNRENEHQGFEKVFKRLEETVRQLEDTELSLDDATRLFEDGMHLAQQCNELLANAELRVSRLKTEFDKQIHLVDDKSEPEDAAQDLMQ